MKIVLVNELPKCDFKDDYPHPDGNDAVYDAPVIPTGSWANMCKSCALSRGNLRIATKFQLREKVKGVDEIEQAVEPGVDNLDYWEEVYINDEAREPMCPVCQEVRRIEPDACNEKKEDGLVYGYKCSGCDTKISISAGVM